MSDENAKVARELYERMRDQDPGLCDTTGSLFQHWMKQALDARDKAHADEVERLRGERDHVQRKRVEAARSHTREVERLRGERDAARTDLAKVVAAVKPLLAYHEPDSAGCYDDEVETLRATLRDLGEDA